PVTSSCPVLPNRPSTRWPSQRRPARTLSASDYPTKTRNPQVSSVAIEIGEQGDWCPGESGSRLAVRDFLHGVPATAVQVLQHLGNAVTLARLEFHRAERRQGS